MELDTTDYGVEASRKLYPAIELLRDPHGLAESVMKRIQKTGSNAFRFEHKLLAVNFVTRVVGNHELLLLPLYPMLRRYMGGHQRDVTQILAYAVQACHETVPPEDIHGVLKTIAHNFITERCSGEQIAVGINACRAICARTPSTLIAEDSNTLLNDDDDGNLGNASSSVSVDVEAFARDLAGYAKHRDRSVAVAGRSWTNFVREVHPSLLQGKDRGTTGSALHRAGERPLRYGEQRVSYGVEGADLLVEYESKKAAYLKKKQERKERGEDSSDEDDEDDDDGIRFKKMKDTDEGSDEWVEVEEDDDNDADIRFEKMKDTDEGSDEWVEVEEDDDNDAEIEAEDDDENLGDDNDNTDDNDDFEEVDDEQEIAPNLVPVKIVNGKPVPIEEEEKTVDLSTMTAEERAKLKEEVSSTRVFTASDFEKMRKLVERQERLKRDPRAAARLKRRRAQGKEFEELSDDDSDDYDSEEEGKIHVKGAVNAIDIMADTKKKRANKMERLEKILTGREQFEHKRRDGGSTNTEKKRHKSFLMTKFSNANRTKQGSKETARRGTLKKTKKSKQMKHENKKRRRKL